MPIEQHIYSLTHVTRESQVCKPFQASIHSLTDLSTHPAIQSPTLSLPPSANQFTPSLNLLAHLHTQSLTRPITHSLTQLLTHHDVFDIQLCLSPGMALNIRVVPEHIFLWDRDWGQAGQGQEARQVLVRVELGADGRMLVRAHRRDGGWGQAGQGQEARQVLVRVELGADGRMLNRAQQGTNIPFTASA